jgi:hypothetical protein
MQQMHNSTNYVSFSDAQVENFIKSVTVYNAFTFHEKEKKMKERLFQNV